MSENEKAVLTREEFVEHFSTIEWGPSHVTRILAHDAALREEVERLKARVVFYKQLHNRERGKPGKSKHPGNTRRQLQAEVADLLSRLDGTTAVANIEKARADKAEAHARELYEESIDAAKRYKIEIDEAESRVARLEAEVAHFAALCNENGVQVELLTEALRKIIDGPVCPCGAEQARDVARRALEEKL